MKYVYMTMLSEEPKYIGGLIGIYYMLKDTGTDHEIWCAVTDRINKNTRDFLEEIGFKLVDIPYLPCPEYTLKNTDNNLVKASFSKLTLFNLKQFDKIVYLDFDLFILQNIDDLFDKPHLSGVIDHVELGEINPKEHSLNAGVLVIEPNKVNYKEIIDYVYSVDKVFNFVDQDVINSYFNWMQCKEYFLPLYYNISAYGLYSLKKQYGFNINNTKILHFLHTKPGSYNNIEKEFSNYIEDGSLYVEGAKKYMYYLNSVYFKLKSKGLTHPSFYEIKNIG